jgi:hypothetical protein
VHLLDGLERLGHMIGIGRFRVGHHDEPTDDRIDLGQLHPVEFLDGSTG